MEEKKNGESSLREKFQMVIIIGKKCKEQCLRSWKQK